MAYRRSPLSDAATCDSDHAGRSREPACEYLTPLCVLRRLEGSVRKPSTTLPVQVRNPLLCNPGSCPRALQYKSHGYYQLIIQIGWQLDYLHFRTLRTTLLLRTVVQVPVRSRCTINSHFCASNLPTFPLASRPYYPQRLHRAAYLAPARLPSPDRLSFCAKMYCSGLPRRQ